MHKPSRLTGILIATGIMLASLATTASAGRLSISNRNIRVVWAELNFAPGEEANARVRCEVTLEGSFHSATLRKVVGALIGHITRAIVRHPCREGEAWVHNGIETPTSTGVTPASSLPWHITYEGFNGTLPNITGVKLLLEGIRFTIEAGGGLCLAVYGNATENIVGIASLNAEGKVTSLEPEANSRVNRREIIENFLGAACPPTGRLTGAGSVTLLGNTTSIFIRLI